MGVLQKPQAIEKEHNNRPFKIPLANKIDTETVKKWLKRDANLSITQHKDQINLWPTAQEQAIMWLYMHKLRIRSVGILAGQIMKGELVPEHPLAMSHALSQDLNTVELKYEDAMQYLRKNEVKPPEGSIKGWNLMTYKGLALGWGKVLQNRINNAYPTNWRVLKY